MSQLLSIVDNKIVISNLELSNTEGNVTHTGSLTVQGELTVDQNINVNGTINVDTLRVKKLITDNEDTVKQLDAFTFEGSNSRLISNKGLLWKEPGLIHQFVFKEEPRRIWSTESIDLYRECTYQIDGVVVLSPTHLGSTVTKSNLQTVGVLDTLAVRGNSNLSNTVFVNGTAGRVGINTDTANAALSVLENGVEVILGTVNNTQQAVIGTWGAHALNLVTDNTTRITINGDTTTFGNAKSKTANVKIYGTLEVDSVVSDLRIERTSSLEFVNSDNNSIYGKGVLWKATGPTKQFVLVANPDRFYSTESIELSPNKEILINGQSLLTETTLGPTVVNSSLETLGRLKGLEVEGSTTLSGSVHLSNDLSIVDQYGAVALTTKGITTNASFSIANDTDTELFIGAASVSLGNKNNTARPVTLYGKVAVNISNPDPTASLSVAGAVVFDGKKFANADAPPFSGSWNKGDIVWNTNPQENNYVGWVCVTSGTPGIWRSFGHISEK